MSEPLDQSAKLFERAKKVSPGGVHSPVRGFRGVGGIPRFMQSARGSEMFDVDGKKYIDFCMSWGPMLFGHQDPEILEAVQSALSRGWSYGTAEPYSLELAELMTSTIPWVQKVRFVNSGTEAVMSAARVARAATGRSKLLKFDGTYHGHADSFLVRAGSGLADMASPDSAGVPASIAHDTIVAPLDDLKTLETILELHGKDIAAVCIEAVPANNGLLLQKKGFNEKVIELAHRWGALVIYDEVITGFRVGLGGMAQFEQLSPDLVCYGKIIGGGFPVGAYGGRADLMDQVAPAGPVYQAGTLSANPVAMSAGLAMLKKLKRENPYRALELKTEKLSQEIEKLIAKANQPIRVQRFASMFWMIFGEVQTADHVVRTPAQTPSTQKERYSKAFHSLLNHGVYLAPSGYEVSFFSTAHRESDTDLLLTEIERALKV